MTKSALPNLASGLNALQANLFTLCEEFSKSMKDSRTPFMSFSLIGQRLSTQFLSPLSSPPSVFLVFLLYSWTQSFPFSAPPNFGLGMLVSSPTSTLKPVAFVKAVLSLLIFLTLFSLISSTTLKLLTPLNLAYSLELLIRRPPCGI